MMTSRVVVLAAGRGSRMGQNPTPKVLREIGGFSILEITILKVCHFVEVVVVVSQEILQKHFDKLPQHKNVRYIEQKEMLGTCNALMEGLNSMDGDGNVLVLYGDSPFLEKRTIDVALQFLDSAVADLVLVGFDSKDQNEYGKLVLEDCMESGVVTDVQEGVLCCGLCNSGFLAASVEFFKRYLPMVEENEEKKEFFLTDVVKISRKEGKVTKYIKCDAQEAIGINTEEDLFFARDIMKKATLEGLRGVGVDIKDPCNTNFGYDTKIGRGSTVAPMCVFGKGVKIGKDCKIGSFCNIENAEIGDNVTIESNVNIFGNSKVADNSVIKSFSYLENVTVDRGCIIGSFARMRPEACIGDFSKVGSFVEIKKSKIGKNVKIKHLSYVGDAEIGDGTNIGAGVVVCNYDGFEKHQTKIGKNVFVGSQTTLIAPIEIGEGVVLGSRCLLRNNVESGSLVAPRIENRFVTGGGTRFRGLRTKKEKKGEVK